MSGPQTTVPLFEPAHFLENRQLHAVLQPHQQRHQQPVRRHPHQHHHYSQQYQWYQQVQEVAEEFREKSMILRRLPLLPLLLPPPMLLFSLLLQPLHLKDRLPPTQHCPRPYR